LNKSSPIPTQMSEFASSVITFRGCAMSWQCDQMGHWSSRFIYNAFDDATAVLFALLGSPFSDARATALGWAYVAQTLEFLQEVRDGEAITVSSHLVALGRTSVTFVHEMRTQAAAEPVARMESKTVRFDMRRRCATPLEEPFRTHARSFQPGVRE
jgi:acyl-CoA thioester hydrolase